MAPSPSSRVRLKRHGHLDQLQGNSVPSSSSRTMMKVSSLSPSPSPSSSPFAQHRSPSSAPTFLHPSLSDTMGDPSAGLFDSLSVVLPRSDDTYHPHDSPSTPLLSTRDEDPGDSARQVLRSFDTPNSSTKDGNTHLPLNNDAGANANASHLEEDGASLPGAVSASPERATEGTAADSIMKWITESRSQDPSQRDTGECDDDDDDDVDETDTGVSVRGEDDDDDDDDEGNDADLNEDPFFDTDENDKSQEDKDEDSEDDSEESDDDSESDSESSDGDDEHDSHDVVEDVDESASDSHRVSSMARRLRQRRKNGSAAALAMLAMRRKSERRKSGGALSSARSSTAVAAASSRARTVQQHLSKPFQHSGSALGMPPRVLSRKKPWQKLQKSRKHVNLTRSQMLSQIRKYNKRRAASKGYAASSDDDEESSEAEPLLSPDTRSLAPLAPKRDHRGLRPNLVSPEHGERYFFQQQSASPSGSLLRQQRTESPRNASPRNQYRFQAPPLKLPPPAFPSPAAGSNDSALVPTEVLPVPAVFHHQHTASDGNVRLSPAMPVTVKIAASGGMGVLRRLSPASAPHRHSASSSHLSSTPFSEESGDFTGGDLGVSESASISTVDHHEGSGVAQEKIPSSPANSSPRRRDSKPMPAPSHAGQDGLLPDDALTIDVSSFSGADKQLSTHLVAEAEADAGEHHSRRSVSDVHPGQDEQSPEGRMADDSLGMYNLVDSSASHSGEVLGKGADVLAPEDSQHIAFPQVPEVNFVSPAACGKSSSLWRRLYLRTMGYKRNANQRKLEFTIRTVASVALGVLLSQVGPAADPQFSPFPEVMLIEALMTAPTLGGTVEWCIEIVYGSLLGILFPYLIVPLMVSASPVMARIICVVSVFVITFLASYNMKKLLARQYLIATNATVLLHAVIGEDAESQDLTALFLYSPRFLFVIIFGVCIAMAALILPFPRLASVELDHRIRLGYQQTLNIFYVVTHAFLTSDPQQSQMLCARAETLLRKLSMNITSLNALVGNAKREFSSRQKVQRAEEQVEQLERLKEALTGMEEAAKKLHDFDDAHHRFVVLMRAPLSEVATKCEEFVRHAILGAPGKASPVKGGAEKTLDLEMGEMPSVEGSSPIDEVSRLVDENVDALWRAYRHAREVLLYSEEASQNPNLQWSAEDHLISDFFMFSLNDFVLSLRTDPTPPPKRASPLSFARRLLRRVLASLSFRRPRRSFGGSTDSSRCRLFSRVFSKLRVLLSSAVKRARRALAFEHKDALTLALRPTVAMTVATVLYVSLEMFQSVVVIYAVAFVMTDSVGGAFFLVLQRFTGTAAGGCFAFVVVLAVSSSPARLIFMLIWIALCTYPSLGSKWWYALWISAMTSTLILFPGQNVTNNEELAVNRLLMTVLGCGIVLVVSMFIGAKRASTALTERFQRTAGRLKEHIDITFDLYIDHRSKGSSGALHKAEPPVDVEGVLEATNVSASAQAATPSVAAEREVSRLDFRSLVPDEHVEATQELSQAMKAEFSAQLALRTEASNEPQFGSAPFPAEHFEGLIDHERALNRFVVLLVAALSDIDVDAAPLQNQYMKISFERMKANVTTSIDTITHAVALQAQHEDEIAKVEQQMQVDQAKLHKSLKALDTKFNEYTQYVSSVVQEHLAQSNYDADVTFAQYRQLWGLNAFVFCTRAILRHVISMQQTVTNIFNFRLEQAQAAS